MHKRKVVLSVTNDLISDQRMNKVALSLTNAGYNVCLVGRKLKNSQPIKERSYNTHRMRLLFTKKALFYAEYNFRLFFYLLFNKFDIYVANDLDSLPANFIVSKIKRKPLIYDSHEYFTEVAELVGRESVKKVWIFLEKLMLPKIKHSITVCQSIADEYHKLYGVNMEIIRNVPIRKKITTHTNKHPIVQEIKKQNKKIILYQGAVNLGRGVENVIEAMQLIENAVFLVVGDGDVLQNAKQIANKYNVTDKVIFTGKLPFEQLKEITPFVDIGISLQEDSGLSYRYVLPNRLFDYIQSGVPVLVSDLPEMNAVVNKYKVGMIAKNHDAKYLSETLNKMLKPEFADNYKENLSLAATELCWENEEKKLLSIYSACNTRK